MKSPFHHVGCSDLDCYKYSHQYSEKYVSMFCTVNVAPLKDCLQDLLT